MRLACLILALLINFSVYGASDTTTEASSAPQQVGDTIPYKQLPTTPSGSLQRVAIVFIFAIGIGIVAIWLLRRQLEAKGLITKVDNNRIVVAASRRITPKLTLFLVRVDDASYLITQNGSNTQMVRHATNELIAHNEE